MSGQGRQYWRERRRAHRLARRIIHFLSNDLDYVIRLERLTPKRLHELGHNPRVVLAGCVDEPNWTIHVDFRFDVILTVAHEVLHILYEDAPEEAILKMEECLKEHLTNQQAVKIWYYSALCMTRAWIGPTD